MYINLNGPPIELFDFGYAVQLWLHYTNHRVGASAQTTTLQHERALQIQAYPWGVCEIPLEIRGEVSDDSQEEAEEHSEDEPEDNKEEEEEKNEKDVEAEEKDEEPARAADSDADDALKG